MSTTEPEGRLETIKTWLDELIELSQEERGPALQRMRADWADAADEVQELLNAHEAAERHWESRSCTEVEEEGGTPSQGRNGHPHAIGPFEVEGVVGQGSTATIYRAIQPSPIRREVAIKLLRPGAASPDLVRRFRRERQVLASLDHPGIATVIDASETDTGDAFLVLEYVNGAPITDFATANSLSISERVRLMIDVACAVQHAHGRGVLHRDLKPSNILVKRQAPGYAVKIVDFGVAKILERHSPVEGSGQTRTGQIVGTLEYMSPEQAGFGDHSVDVRSDVFSLGAVLYELLSGSPPLVLKDRSPTAFAAFLAALPQHQPPVPLGGRSRAEGLSVDLSSSTLADIDCIVLKALERDPGRRYSAAAGWADDLSRALDGRPIEARPPSFGYTVSRLLRRHRLAASAGAVALLSLFFGIAGLWLGYEREQRVAQTLARSLDESDQLVRAYSELLLGARADRLGPETPLKEAVNSAASRIQSDETLGPAVRGRLALAAAEVLADLEEPTRAIEILELAVDSIRGDADDPALRSKAHKLMGVLSIDVGDLQQAKEHYGLALGAMKESLARGDESAKTGLIFIEEQLASLMDEAGDSAAALALGQSALGRMRQLGAPDSDLAPLHSGLSITALHAGDFALAESSARFSLGVRRALFPADDIRVQGPARVLATALTETGRSLEALHLLEELEGELTLAEEDPRRILFTLSLSMTRLRAEPTAAHAAQAREVAERAISTFGSGHRISLLARVLRLDANLRSPAFDGRQEWEALAADLEETLTDRPADLARGRRSLGQVLLEAGQRDAALPLLRKARAAFSSMNSAHIPLLDQFDRWLDG